MIKPIPVPVDGKRPDWPRLVANALTQLQAALFTPQPGQTRYDSDTSTLQYWNGSAWVAVP